MSIYDTPRRSAPRAGRRVRTAALSSAAAASLLAAQTHAGVASAETPAAPVVTAPAATAVHAAAVGQLAASGCTETAGAATCDLYAMTGSLSLLGRTIPIWGFSTTGAAGSATAPGPVLVVNAGDAVTLTLHNAIDGETMSLALPGQQAVSSSGAIGDDVTGVGSGGTRTYTFTAGRPGTFVYEAGHTANGTRQVAMGLAGALVVLPGDHTAYGAGSTGPSTAYDDDAPLVLSEIDPRLNADPAHFDMRSFRPVYRLVNGEVFPETNSVSTDQGHTVLLRYVNVGSETHSMSLLGADQLEVAQDGHPMRFGTRLAAESIEPGQTVDTLVTMPTGPEAKVAVYEAALHLDNGQHTADPRQFAFGGMLTFLDTNAPAPSTDVVGPTATHIALTPNPSNGLADVTVTADLSDANGGSAVTQAELVVDDPTATGPGFGTPMTGAFGTVDVSHATGTIPTAVLDTLDAGKHTVYVRAMDSAGNWGVVGSAVLSLPKTGPQTVAGSVVDVPANGTADLEISATGDDSAAGGTITAAEYFIDTAGPDGTGTPLTPNRTATVVAESATVPAAQVAALGEGRHHLLIHSKDSLGLWGPTLDVALPVDLTGPQVDAAAIGPNPSNGLLSDKSNPGYLLISAQVTDKDAGGAVQSTLTDAEAFLDPKAANPAGGAGIQLIAVDGRMDSPTESVYGLLPIGQVKALADGDHTVSVRGQDAAGNWGPLFAFKLTVDKTAPVLSAFAASPSPTGGAASLTLTAKVADASLISNAEYWTGTTDPGVGKASPLAVNFANGTVTEVVDLTGVPAGVTQFNLRVKDLAGNWSKAVSTSVTVQPPNAIFSDTFDSGTLAAWSASTGGVSVTAAAGIVGGKGLAVNLPGGRNNRAAYVTDTRPAAEPSYHARFAFNRSTLTSGSNAATALTLFEARNAANAQVFALQYRLSGSQAQLRTVLSRTGATAMTGAWVNLAAGTSTLQLDWQSGGATGTPQGKLVLSVDGAAVQSATGNTSGLKVDTVLLGVTAGVTTTTTGSTAGTAYVDSFVSTRSTMP
ncbi:multicopper oxidase [Motilibacter peucedani]|uniref:Multicopper oxidase n=1 Tax=Motilibacter peucedani TaxID=598650 RepID=A0A420XRA9_9ACTN|nr:multicopper oxidase domain-containing protein [Motilibacter peucedani]RKS77382.1 multicopper oxidase [Motilibacter peucedani]